MKKCIKKAEMQEAGAREEQLQGLCQEAMSECQNKNKNKSNNQSFAARGSYAVAAP